MANCLKLALSPLFLVATVLTTSRHATAEPPKNTTFDAFRFEYTKGDPFERKMLTPEIEKFVGKKIRLRGWIMAGNQSTGITEFYLLRHNLECCFGPEAYLYDNMLVKLNAGLTVDFTNRPVAVDGVFDIHEFKLPDGTWGSVYLLTAEQVK